MLKRLEEQSCWLPYKGKKISANHNPSLGLTVADNVVDYLTKVRKFQLITTHPNEYARRAGCWLPYKGKKISANHNLRRRVVDFKQLLITLQR